MHDDDEFTEFANLQFERVTAGRYVVVGEVRVNGSFRLGVWSVATRPTALRSSRRKSRTY
jgi:hypothetical protein